MTTRAPARYELRRRSGLPSQPPAPHPLGPWLRLLSIVGISVAFWGVMLAIVHL